MLATVEMDRIDQGRRVHDKYVDAMDDLSLVAHVGDSRYGELPQDALSRMRDVDEGFHTNIQAELRSIQQRLQRKHLEAEWHRNPRPGLHELSSEEHDRAMEEWIEEQMGQPGSVNCKLPIVPSPPRGSRGAAARVQSSSPHRPRPAKVGAHDSVEISGKVGVVRRVKADRCKVEFGDGTTGVVHSGACRLTTKAHPGKTFALQPQGDSRRPYTGTSAGSKSGRESDLAALFGEGRSPDFLKPGTRRQQVEDRAAEHRRQMPSKSDAPRKQQSQQRPASSRPNVQPRFMEVHQVQGPVSAVVQKRADEVLRLSFHPDTLVVTDEAEEYASIRGKRITHIGNAEPPLPDSDAVHNAAAVRQQLIKTRGSTVVGICAEPWSQRRAVEKRRREFQERMPSKN